MNVANAEIVLMPDAPNALSVTQTLQIYIPVDQPRQHPQPRRHTSPIDPTIGSAVSYLELC